MKIENNSIENISLENGSFLDTDGHPKFEPGKRDFALRVNAFPYRFIKRGMDIILSLFVICFIFPWLLPVLSILIIVDQGFPVFFVQDRVGLNNRLFKCFKLRTMGSATNVSRNRVSRLGNFLRVYKLDEIPQFFNVLSGEMSAVGPRPHTISDHHIFRKIIGDAYNLRHEVKPGITGLAQVSGYEGKINSVDKLQGRILLDLNYIRNWSIGLENQIIYRTLGVILRGPHRKRRVLDKYAIDATSRKEMNDDTVKWKQKKKLLKELHRDG